MHFSSLTYAPNAPSPLAATVDDELFTGATVPFDDLARPERGYAARIVERILEAWLGARPEAGARFRLEMTEEGPRALFLEEAGRSVPARPFASLDEAAQAAVRRDLQGLLSLVQGILRIDGGAGPARKQRRGELGD